MSDEINKGGEGSGKKGHTTDRTNKYGTREKIHEHDNVQVTHSKHSWGSLRSAKTGHGGIDGGVVIHPEHFEEMKQVHERRKEQGHFKDEQGKHWTIKPNDKDGVSLHGAHGPKIHLDAEHMKHLKEEPKGDPGTEGMQAMKKSEDLEKGGPGSGKKGHTTLKMEEHRRQHEHHARESLHHKERRFSKEISEDEKKFHKEREDFHEKEAHGHAMEYAKHKDAHQQEHKKHVDYIMDHMDQANDHDLDYDSDHHRNKLMSTDSKKVKEQHDNLKDYMNFKPGKVKKSDPFNPEPMYKAEARPYEGQDINDLIEAEMEKGGPGSGIKGHQTKFSHPKGGNSSH